jgi:lysozyme family protein
MDLSFEALRDDIAKKWAAMTIRPQHLAEIDRIADKLLADKGHYLTLEEATGVPALITMVISERESGGNLRCSLAQGDRWDRVSVHVPAGVGPFASWLDAAVWSLKHERMAGRSRDYWTIERALYDQEAYNGFGYRRRLGTSWPSPYVWAMTNLQRPGKYLSDGYLDVNAWDDQVGAAPLMARLIAKDLSLALPGSMLASEVHPTTAPLVMLPDTESIQIALNKLVSPRPPLEVDGDYGSLTKAVARKYQESKDLQDDGIVGPITWAAMKQDLGIG